MKIRFTQKARSQAKAADAWWSAHSEVPNLFESELLTALDRILAYPLIRQPHVVHGQEMRRVLMPRTRHHVYYTVEAAGPEIVIHAVWGATRGEGPTT